MTNNSSQKNGGWGVLIGAALLVISAWGAWAYQTLQQWPKDENPDRLARFGQIGDTFGSLNTLFSGLAISGVVFTLYRQHQDSKEADERHSRDLKAQRASARVTMLASVINYHRSALERLDHRTGEYLKLAGFQGYFHQQIRASDIFSHAAFNQGTPGLDFYTLATQLLGDLSGKTWSDVEGAIIVTVPLEMAEIKVKRTEHSQLIQDATTEADALTDSKD